MQIGVLGIDHRGGVLDVREAFSRAVGALMAAAPDVAKKNQCVPLFTCNRGEIFFSAPDLLVARQEILAYLHPHLPFSFRDVGYSFLKSGCFVHLAKVTAGLESAILAETDIQRQVKNAYMEACEKYPLDATLHFLFQKSLKIGKSIRSAYPLWTGTRGLEGALYTLAKREMGDFEKKSILFLGNSKTNRKNIAFFKGKGCQRLSLGTRRVDQAQELRQKYGIEVKELGAISNFDWFDVIVAATTADEYVLKKEQFFQRSSPVVLCDLSVPRVIDPGISTHEGVKLFNMEEISSWVKQSVCHHDVLEVTQEIERAVERQIEIYHNKQKRSGVCECV